MHISDWSDMFLGLVMLVLCTIYLFVGYAASKSPKASKMPAWWLTTTGAFLAVTSLRFFLEACGISMRSRLLDVLLGAALTMCLVLLVGLRDVFVEKRTIKLRDNHD